MLKSIDGSYDERSISLPTTLQLGTQYSQLFHNLPFTHIPPLNHKHIPRPRIFRSSICSPYPTRPSLCNIRGHSAFAPLELHFPFRSEIGHGRRSVDPRYLPTSLPQHLKLIALAHRHLAVHREKPIYEISLKSTAYIVSPKTSKARAHPSHLHSSSSQLSRHKHAPIDH